MILVITKDDLVETTRFTDNTTKVLVYVNRFLVRTTELIFMHTLYTTVSLFTSKTKRSAKIAGIKVKKIGTNLLNLILNVIKRKIVNHILM